MFEKLEPESANGSEALLLSGAIQQSLDYGDSINYIDYFRYPIPGTQAKPIMLTMGNDDSMVTNESSVAAAQLLDLSIVGDVLVDMLGVRLSDDFDAGGYGLKQYEPVYDPRFLEGDIATELSHASAHLIFVRKKDKEDQKTFIQRFLMDE
ncbi:MAG: hypothetical protein SVC26_03925 [Pseudomonadota bacterium]|nr:hypothetical protein [Pseudomonadota bacterium]